MKEFPKEKAEGRIVRTQTYYCELPECKFNLGWYVRMNVNYDCLGCSDLRLEFEEVK